MSTLTFSPRRVGHLMRHDIYTQKKSLITGFATLAGIAFGAYLLVSATGGSREVLTNIFMNMLVIGGFVASSIAFSEIHDKKTGIHYVMLPGSTLEKYVAKLVLTSLGWTAAVIITYAAATALGAGVASLFFATRIGIIVPTTRALWISIASYLVTQSIFLFGSIYFRKVAFLRTALSAIVVAFALGLVYLLATRIVFAPVFVGLFEVAERFTGSDPMVTLRLSDAQGAALLRALGILGDILTWVIVPVFFWVAGVLRLRETEV